MSERLGDIDLNSDAAFVEAVDTSEHETLKDIHGELGRVGDPIGDGSRVLGEVKGYGNGVSVGLGAEMEGTRKGIDLEKGENGNIECEVMTNNNGFVEGLDVDRIENKADSVFEGGEKEIDAEKGENGSVGRGIMMNNDGFVSRLDVAAREKEPDRFLVGGEKETEVAQLSEMNSGILLPKALSSEMDGTEGKIKTEESNAIGVFANAGNGSKSTNDSGLNVDEIENKPNRVFVGDEEENELGQVPEMHSNDTVVEATRDGTEGKIKIEESNLSRVFVHAGNGTKINLVVDLNARHVTGEEILSGNGIDNKESEVKEVWGVSNVPLLDSGVNNVVSDSKGVGPNENQDIVVKEQMTEVRLEYVDGNDFRVVALRPKMRGDECQAEKEGEYYLSDLVWVKVRSHRWWPGQIFEPSAASEKAIKHFKKDSYLIAYFGDQTFAWNEATKLKPFRMYFTELEKQSNTSAFCRAVDCTLAEVSRRIEFGLSCSCLPEEKCAKIKSQHVVNAGIREESSRRDGGDTISSAATFLPVEVFQHLKLLAAAPHFGTGRLRFVTARARLLAFNRWKSSHHLPEVLELDSFLKKDVDVPASGEDDDLVKIIGDKVQGSGGEGEVSSQAIQDSSWKRKHESGDDEGRKKVRSVTDILSDNGGIVENGEKKFKKKRGRKKGSFKKCQADKTVSGNSELGRKKRLLLPRVQKESHSRPKKFTKVGEGVRRAANQVGGTTTSLESCQRIPNRVAGVDGENLVDVGCLVPPCSSAKSQFFIPDYIPTPEEMLSKLCLAASDPMGGYRSSYSIISLFSDFRNSICLQNTNAQNHEKSTEEYKVGKTSISGIAETFEFEGIEDSYWTDRIIQSNPEERVLFELENTPGETTPLVHPGNAVSASPSLDNTQYRGAGDLELEAENPGFVNDLPEECSPTTLALKFNDLESVPSVRDLNKIFSCYGPLEESETKVFAKSKHASIVFKRRADAETAFSSAGKYSIFGPSLLSYCLKPTPSRASAASKRNGKDAKSAKHEVQFEG